MTEIKISELEGLAAADPTRNPYVKPSIKVIAMKMEGCLLTPSVFHGDHQPVNEETMQGSEGEDEYEVIRKP